MTLPGLYHVTYHAFARPLPWIYHVFAWSLCSLYNAFNRSLTKVYQVYPSSTKGGVVALATDAAANITQPISNHQINLNHLKGKKIQIYNIFTICILLCSYLKEKKLKIPNETFKLLFCQSNLEILFSLT
jgi:hypothetical protein